MIQQTKDGLKRWVGIAVLALGLSGQAHAGGFEISLGGSFSKSTYTAGNYAWTRRLGGSIGYEFMDRSEIEYAFQDIVSRTLIQDYEDTTFHDQIFSLSWIQYLLGRNAPVQPYVKAGIGQLNREATGQYAGGASPARRVDAVTGVIGGGVRIYVTRTFAIRVEASSYLEGGQIATWRDNSAVTVGASIQL